MPRWLHRWKVPSRSNPDKTYTVARDAGGTWGCSCPHWINRLQKTGGHCAHIKQVIASKEEGHPADTPMPMIVPTLKCKEVTRATLNGDDVVYVPLIPVGVSPLFSATIVYDLLRQGFTYTELKSRPGPIGDMAKRNSRKVIVGVIRNEGRCVVDEWSGNLCPTTYITVPAPVPDGL